MRPLSLAIVLVLISIDLAHALSKGAIAIVEQIDGNPPGVEEMDFLPAGHVLRLGTSDTVVLSYLKSCQRETITGATIIVGSEQSDVQGGSVTRERIACDGGQLEITKQLSVGGAVFRDPPNKVAPPLLALRPQFMLYGRSPAVELSTAFPVIIERVDRRGERYELVPDRNKRSAFYDFADDHKVLVSGGVYQSTMGSARVLFQVGLSAQPGRTPLAGRILMLPPHN